MRLPPPRRASGTGLGVRRDLLRTAAPQPAMDAHTKGLGQRHPNVASPPIPPANRGLVNAAAAHQPSPSPPKEKDNPFLLKPKYKTAIRDFIVSPPVGIIQLLIA